MDELQFTLGEGPSVDVLDRRVPALASDLSSAGSGRRWPTFAPAADQLGVRAVFAFPLQAGVVREGVLTLYRTEQGMLSRSELADSLVYADAAMLVALDAGRDLLDETPAVGDSYDELRAEVHQAAGMASVQLATGVEGALVRLRAYAYVHNRRLADVSRDVVARRLRFTPVQARKPTSDEDGPGTGARA